MYLYYVCISWQYGNATIIFMSLILLVKLFCMARKTNSFSAHLIYSFVLLLYFILWEKHQWKKNIEFSVGGRGGLSRAMPSSMTATEKECK